MAAVTTLKTLRNEYGVSEKMFNEWIEPIRNELFLLRYGKNKKHYRLRTLIPSQVKKIRAHLGNPSEYKKE